MTQTVLLGDVLEIQKESLNPSKFPDTIYNVFSIPGYDKGSPEKLCGREIKSNKFLVKPGSILVSKLNPRIPRVWKVDNAHADSISSTEFVVLRMKPGYESLFDFLYAVMSSEAFSVFLQSHVKGTSGSHQRIKPEDIYGYEVTIDDKYAKKTGEFIKSIDEKIELNRRMNQTLEQMGQALFRHYFIDNPEAEKWGKVALGDKIKPRRGKSLQSKNMKPGGVPVVSGGLQPAGLHDESNTTAPVITISASGANAGFTALWDRDVWSADSSFIDTTITPHVYFYYLFLSRNQKRIYEMQTGSGQPHIYPSHLELLELPNAPEELIAEFNERVTDNFKKIEENKKQIQTLTTLRDTLLPRLINGKIQV